MKAWGIALIGIGLAIIAYALIMDVTVPYGLMHWERVSNAELMSRRTMLAVLGAASAVSGVILLSVRARSSIDSNGTRPANTSGFQALDAPAKPAAMPQGSGASHGWVAILPATSQPELERRLGVARELGLPVVSGLRMPIHCGYYDSRAAADQVCQRLIAECGMDAKTKYMPPQ
ncbi:hypothetical protein BG030_17130 [Pseudomonas putida]|nr:hypothetical protein BG030_17130 [Pseudomonas putida]